MGFTIENLARLFIGLQGESNARQIDIDMSEWVRDWPNAKVDVLVQRPGEDNTYPVETELRGGHLLWSPRREDVLIAGMGKAQIVLTDRNDVELRSRVVQTIIGESIAGTEGDAPDPTQGWVHEVLQAADKVKESVDAGEGGLYLVTASVPEGGRVPYADRTQEEIRAAVAAGKTCVLVYIDGRVFTYCGEIPLSQAPYDNCPTFLAPGNYKTTEGLEYWRAQVNDSGAVLCNGYKPAKTPNPYALTIKQGDKTTTYNGSGQVTVEIPEGVPDPGKPHQQLVSDKDGKAVWEERLAWKEAKQITFADNMAFDATEDDDGDGVEDKGYILQPFAGTFEVGKTYMVSYGGQTWDCPAVATPADAPFDGVVLGNTASMGDGFDASNPDAPFAMFAMNTPMESVYGVFFTIGHPMPDAITITGKSVTTKKIDPEYLPDTHKVITIMIDADGNVMCDTPFAEASKMTCGELQSALKIVQTGNYGGKPASLEADVQVRRSAVEAVGEMLEITFRQLADPGDIPGGRETTRYIYWSSQGLQFPAFKLYSLPVMAAGWGYDQQTYYLRSVGGKWQPVSIEQMKQELGIGGGVEPATTDVFYTADGQVFTTLEGAVMHVQKGEQ